MCHLWLIYLSKMVIFIAMLVYQRVSFMRHFHVMSCCDDLGPSLTGASLAALQPQRRTTVISTTRATLVSPSPVNLAWRWRKAAGKTPMDFMALQESNVALENEGLNVNTHL